MPNVIALPAFSDNYIWILVDAARKHAVIIDPGDPLPVLQFLSTANIKPLAILITHHHRDHIGGIPFLLQHYPNLPVYGPNLQDVPESTHIVTEGDEIHFPELNLRLTIFSIPGHTNSHIAFYGKNQLFCGDTLFTNGCGHARDGNIFDLYRSLTRLSQLPPETKVYCSHEYTLDNIGFARQVEPGNTVLYQRQEVCYDRLDRGEPTIPSTIGLELATNPFLRLDQAEIITNAEKKAQKKLHSAQEVFVILRKWKDAV